MELALDSIPLPADKSLLDESRETMMGRLRKIHADGGETETGVMIVTIEGVVSGDPESVLHERGQGFHIQRSDTGERLYR